jgi:hypothetical protein
VVEKEQEMSTDISPARVNIAQLILIPSVITLAITLLRLTGELEHWSPVFFSREPGGGGALVGISWLAPVFGIYFALKLAKAGVERGSTGRTLGLAVLGLILLMGGSALVVIASKFPGQRLVGLLLMLAAGYIQLYGWPVLAKVLFAYGFAARIPVAIVMFLAMDYNWGTHYDALPPNSPVMHFWIKYLMAALLPQLIVWPVFTVIAGTLFGVIAVAIFHRRGTPEVASATS